MPRLSDAQFQGYEFRARAQPGGNVNVVVGRKGGEAEEALGSMNITSEGSGDRNWVQRQINQGRRAAGSEAELRHGQTEDPETGQQQWTEGNMGANISRVSWLGMSKEAPKALLKGMMGLAVGIHGRLPHADYELSQHGSAISQGAARKYGVKPHPENPSMHSTFTYSGPGDDREEVPDWAGGNRYDDPDPDYDEGEEEVKYGAEQAWATSDMSTGAGINAPAHQEGEFRGDRWQAFTAAQVHGITQDVEKNILKRRLRVDPRVPVHPSQGKLWGQQEMFP